MASGKITLSCSRNSSKYSVFIDWIATPDLKNNKSSVTATLKVTELSSTDFDTVSAVPVTLTVNGTPYKEDIVINTDDGTQKTYTIKTVTTTIDHGTDGKKSITISAGFTANCYYNGTYYGPGTVSGSGTATFDNIDVTYPTVTQTISNIGVDGFKISASSGTTVCDIFEYKINTGAWTAFPVATTTTTAASVTLTGKTPNTTYTVTSRARKDVNEYYGSSVVASVTTIGNTTLVSVDKVAIDAVAPTMSVKWQVYNASYKHKIVIRDKANNNTKFYEVADFTGTVGTYAISLSLTNQRNTILQKMANLTSYTCELVVTTFSGTTQIGLESKMDVIFVTDSEVSKPYFDGAGFSWQDINDDTFDITGNRQVFIQNHSRLKVISPQAVARNQAAIKQYTAALGTTILTSSSATLSGTAPPGTEPTDLVKSKDNRLTISAVDSRNYSVSQQLETTVIPYNDITISELNVGRTYGTEPTIWLNFNGTISEIELPTSSGNFVTSALYRYKVTNSADSTFTQWYPISVEMSGETFSYQTDILNIDEVDEHGDPKPLILEPEFSYTFEVRIADRLSEDFYSKTIPLGTPLMAFRKKVVGINQPRPDPRYSLDMGGHIKQFLQYTSERLDNLNLPLGLYWVDSLSTTIPYGYPGIVENMGYDFKNLDGSYGARYRIQRLTSALDGRTWVRSYYHTAGWKPWIEK